MPGGRSRNPRGHGERLRTDILEAAGALVAEAGGTSELSLRKVAKAVGIAATSVYLHFPDIDHLRLALVDDGFAELNRYRAAAADGINDPAAAALARWRAYSQFAVDHPGHYRLMFGPELPQSLAFDAADSPGRQAFMAGVEGIARCQQAGVALTTEDPFRLAALAWSAVHGLVSLRIDRPNFPWPPLADMVDEVLHRLVGLPLTAADRTAQKAATS